ncbi:tyrosine-type recombinase/integrase [Thalassotalea agariperforans]
MNDKQIRAFIKTGEIARKQISDGLYIRVQTAGKAYWEVRYSMNGKRRFMRIAGGQYPSMSLAVAKLESALIKQKNREGIDPLAERVRESKVTIKTVNHLFDDWYVELSKRLKFPNIPKRIYQKEIKPLIGDLAIEQVNARDIRTIIQKVSNSGRPSIANDTLAYCKQLFNHACKLDLVTANPASAFKVSDAGGIEKSRDRILDTKELEIVFSIFRENQNIFTRDNYLAVALLVSLGVRKGELIAAKWQEFDIEKQLWNMPEERSKTGVAITIPLTESVLNWLKELKVRSAGSEYVFPSRRASKRRGYISDDTLNHALAKMFGMKVDSNKEPYPNLLGNAGVKHFTVHDLRRTCRSLLAKEGVAGHIAERCLNHKLKGVEGIYDRYDYFDERREALDLLNQVLSPIII